MIWGILIVLIVVCLGFLAWLFCIAPASPRGGKDEECKGFFRALFWRNLWTNVLTRPHFEAYDVHFRNNISHRIACDKMKMQEVNWTLRTAEEYKVCKNAGALCIFEFIRPEITDEDE